MEVQENIFEDGFKLLPKELTELILSELDAADLARASGVNLYWNKVASSDLLWRKFFVEYRNVTQPLKAVYGNRKVNWMTLNYKLSRLEHPHGTFYLAKVFPGSNKMYTGCLSDVMEEWDLDTGTKQCEYEVPTGPASNYRMDAQYCLIERDSGLRRWKRHRQAAAYGNSDEFDWAFTHTHDEHEPYYKPFQTYQFVHERCVMCAIKDDATIVFQVHNMDTNSLIWKYEVKLEQANNGHAGYGYRMDWDALAVTYDHAVAVFGNHVIIFDMNKQEVKFHWQDEDPTTKTPDGTSPESFSVCCINDLILAAKTSKVHFFSLSQGELLFVVEITQQVGGASNYGWAKMDSEKAIVSLGTCAYVIDIQTRKLIGEIEWRSVSSGWTQDIIMNEEFFAVLATDEILVYDFRKRTKEQEQRDAEELKRIRDELEQKREEERQRIREQEEEQAKYALEHPDSPASSPYDDRSWEEKLPHDSHSVSSDEQPHIPTDPNPDGSTNNEDSSSDEW